MAKRQQVHRKKNSSGAFRFFRGLYITVFAFSLVIVVGYIAFRIWAPAPDVDDQVVFHPVADDGPGDTAAPSAEPTAAPSAAPSQEPDGVVFHRRDGIYTCLLIGSADMGGTDTMMLGVFDTGNKTASLISLPRDTVVRVKGENRKLNSVQSVGGTDLLVSTVSRMLAVPVDYYVEVDTYAFRAIVDKIGGVYFDVPVNMDYDDPYQDLHIHIKKGYQLLNGKQALGVMRCRSCYASADIGRTQTQRKFLTALAKQTVTLSNVDKVPDLINILSSYVTTDMQLNRMVWFATQAVGMDLDTALTTAVLPGEWISPYYELDDEGVLELINGLGLYEEELSSDVLNICHP